MDTLKTYLSTYCGFPSFGSIEVALLFNSIKFLFISDSQFLLRYAYATTLLLLFTIIVFHLLLHCYLVDYYSCYLIYYCNWLLIPCCFCILLSSLALFYLNFFCIEWKFIHYSIITITCYIYSVLDLDAFERTNKAESLGVVSADGSSSNSGENLQDADFTCKLFRFLQLLCEGHNASKCCCHAAL